MKSIKNIFPFFLVALLIPVLITSAKSQMLDTTNIVRIKLEQSNERFPSWDKDGKRVVFQSSGKGYSQLFLYDFFKDTLVQITTGKTNKSHPVFIPNENSIAFDAATTNEVYLFKLNLATGEQQPLFQRKLFCKAPSFSPSGRLVIFKGYDLNSETWQLFSYDFIYDNLNQLTHLKNKELLRPMLSPDGKTILFGTRDKAIPFNRSLHEINWYGEKTEDMDSIAASSYCWLPNSYRVVCSTEEPGSHHLFFTVRKDGAYKMPLCNDTLQRVTPALSPDGKKIAVAVKFGNNFDIVVYNLIDE